MSEQSQQVAVLFLQQYLSIYDSEDRQPLLNAYHDSAVLSMSVSFAPGQAATGAGRYSSASRLIILALLFSPYYSRLIINLSSVINIYAAGWTHT